MRRFVVLWLSVTSSSVAGDLFDVDGSDLVWLGDSMVPYGELGTRIGVADLDADGIADLIAGDQSGSGHAWVLLGPRSGETSVDDADMAFDYWAGWWGGEIVGRDADGDGDDDLLFGPYMFLGPMTSGGDVATADATFLVPHTNVAATIIGDHDGDGLPDVALSDMDFGELVRRGKVYVASGTTTGTMDLGADATYTYQNLGGDELGFAITAVGDINGDGIDDLALGVPGSDVHSVYVVAGGEPAGTYGIYDDPLTVLSSGATDRFGASMDATDYDGDGYADLFVGAPSERPAVYAFLGPLEGRRRESADADTRWYGTRGLGSSVAARGDVDADGQPDVLLGARHPRGSGTVYLQLGESTGVIDVADLLSFRSTGRTYLGQGIAFVPDWTGDGGSEVAISEPSFINGGVMPGRVVVVFSENLY